ncbi:fungal specific transcription factor domain protein [Diplodia corticola]|uniref:Fungal specific transcription factor domain protein n=1 Tax=Diplodia corticola TaxID=236234 RepID=A0A1J9R496_9PEZI|nr:fungal specific transcription factor domain protein [Diplodia corticola]OJD35424.1 fungal specific transcription factor domain protein [Diplodia corticola]
MDRLTDQFDGGSGAGSSRCSFDESFFAASASAAGDSNVVVPPHQLRASAAAAVGSDDYVKALESRLDRVESLIKASGILDGKQAAPDVAGHVDYDVDIDALLADAGESADSDLSRGGTNKSQDFWKHAIWQTRRPRWISDIIEDVVTRSLGPPVSLSARENHVDARRFSQYAQLPPMEDVLSLVADFFAGVNNLLPLYHEHTFMQHLYENLSRPAESAGWLASINTVLALGHISRLRTTFISQEQEREAWKYMKNAMAIQSELPALDFDLLSVQALIGMTIFMLLTSCNSQMPSMMLATAIRVAQGIGLHVDCNDPRMSEMDKEQRRRVFWISYIFDRELSIRTGRAPIIQDATDMSISLPTDNPSDGGIGHIGPFNMFRARCTFAQIQGKIYKQLYSDHAWAQPRRDVVLDAITALDAELEAWRQHIPPDLRPGGTGPSPSSSYPSSSSSSSSSSPSCSCSSPSSPSATSTTSTTTSPSSRPLLPPLPAPYDSSILVLHFCYWYAFSLLHRRYAICISVTRDWPAAPASVPPLLHPPHPSHSHHSDPIVSPTTPGAHVTASARAMVHLLQCHPPTAKGTRWYLLYYCAAALVNLFGEVVDRATATTTATTATATTATTGGGGGEDAEVQGDLARMRDVLGFMAVVCEEDNRDARHIFGLCGKMEAIAVGCVGRAKAERKKEGQEGEGEEVAAAANGGDGGDREEGGRRWWRDEEVVAIQRQMRVHGRFFSPVDV